MNPGDREYRNETLSLPGLFVTTDVLSNVRFVQCVLTGPGVLALQGGTLSGCSFDAPGDDMFWVYPDSKRFLVGVLDSSTPSSTTADSSASASPCPRAPCRM
jgi:hypothetical protein